MGVDQSYEKAVEYYTLAADQGYASAQSNLGLMYSQGQGVNQSYEKAVELYIKAAEQGNAIALDNLGYMYENGFGVEQSDEKAIEYYREAAAKGNKASQDRADELEKRRVSVDNQNENPDNNGGENNAYSFISDHKAIEEAALSLFYVEMYDADAEWLGTASGFVTFDEHLFVTNQHVIEGAAFLKIWDEKDNMYVLDKVIASDKTHDIAILLFPDGDKYTSLKQMDAFNLQRGQRAITIGSPRGFQGTVADGVISSFPEMKQYDWLKVIQFSAAISAGSSGGALFDDEGNVIGITTSSMDDAQNLNFAIPITEVQKLYKKWDKKTYELLGTKKSWDLEGTR